MLRKTAIITGASGGIGSATAIEFAKLGYNVALTYNKHSTKALEKELRNYDIEVRLFKLDQTHEEEITTCFKEIFSSFEYIDAVIINAGKSEKYDLLTNKSVKDIDSVLNTNLRGTILIAREAQKYLLKQKHGVIINVSSMYAQAGGQCEAVYTATKAGVNGLTRALALECAPFVRVNAVEPGYIDTKMNSLVSEEEKAELIQLTPMKRIGTGEDVANLICFLASDKASFITGECYRISGGVMLFN